jgi:hypothetical protein
MSLTKVFEHSSNNVMQYTAQYICIVLVLHVSSMDKRNSAPMEIQHPAKASCNIYSITIAVLLKSLNSERHVSGTTGFLVS